MAHLGVLQGGPAAKTPPEVVQEAQRLGKEATEQGRSCGGAQVLGAARACNCAPTATCCFPFLRLAGPNRAGQDDQMPKSADVGTDPLGGKYGTEAAAAMSARKEGGSS